VIFESLKKLHNSGRFLVESELLTLVLSGIGDNKTNKVHISDYFTKCHGRTEYKFNWNTNGTIKRRAISEDRFKYIIKFEYDASLVEAIKSIPGRKYDSQKQDWEVPMEYEEEVFSFAKRYKFLYDSEGNKYANNLHLGKLVVGSWPKGISLCEGQEAQDLHKYYNCKFWWCASSPCFKSHKIKQTADEWEDLTLLDFCVII